MTERISSLRKDSENLKVKREWALELLALVLRHPSTWQWTKDRAAPLIAELEVELSPDLFAAAQARGRARDLDATVKELLVELSRRDKVTIFISTHFMNEALRCDRISLMHAGQVLVYDEPKHLLEAKGAASLEDAFIGYLVGDHARYLFDEGDPYSALLLGVRMLEHCVRSAALGGGFDLDVLGALRRARHRSGGAGAAQRASLGGRELEPFVGCGPEPASCRRLDASNVRGLEEVLP